MLRNRSSRRVCQVAVESIESRILLSATLTTLAQFNTYDAAQGGVVVDSQGDIFGTTQANSGAYGTLWELPEGENTINTLVTFSGNNGSDPGSFLSIDAAGDIFGTTAAGGLDGYGIVWELPVNATNITRLASYGGVDGNQLGNGLALQPDGDIYVIAEAGSNGNGAILELPSGANSFSVIATFAADSDPIGRPVIDSAGDIFSVTAEGGTNGVGALNEITANLASFQVIASFTASNATPQGDLRIDQAGDIFGTTNNNFEGATTSTVFEVPGGSLIIDTLASQTSSSSSYIEPGLVRDSNGNLFGATVGTIGQASTVFEIPVNGNSYGTAVTLATIPEFDNEGVNTNAATGFLSLDAAGNLYGTTQSTAPTVNDSVFEIAGVAAPQVGSQLIISQEPTQTIVQNVITPAITVEIEDSNNNLVPLSDTPVSVRISTGPSGASLGGTLSVDAINGVATFSNLNINETGSYSLLFTAPLMSSATTGNFKIIPSPLDGSHLVFTLPPSPSTTAGQKLQEFIVTAEQPSDAVSTKTKGTVTLSITTGPTNGKLLGGKTAPLKQGVAIFKKLSFDVAGTYTLEATDTASIAATPVSFEITATTPKKMVVVQQPAAKIDPNQTFTFSVELRDKYGNIATNDDSSVSLVLSGSNKEAVLTGTAIEDVENGIASFDDLSIITPGHYVLKAADGSERLKVNSKGFKIT